MMSRILSSERLSVSNVMKKFIIVTLVAFVVMLLAVAVVGSVMTGRSLDECFFGVCCGVLKNSVLVSGDIPVTRSSEQGPGY